MPSPNDYRILDDDLTRIGHAEGAGRIASRPLRRFGIVLAAVLLVVLLAAFGGAGLPVTAPVALGFSVAIYLGLNIGANDVANSAGPAIGVNAMPVTLGLAGVALAQLLGAVIAGQSVTDTIARDILEIGEIDASMAPARIMTSALIGASIWLSLANWARAPVSTTHSVIGAVAGAGIAGLGADAVNWAVLAGIAGSWVAAPIISAIFAAALLGFLRWRVQFAPDRAMAARVWLPVLLGLTAAVFAAYMIMLIEAVSLGYLEMAFCALLGIVAGIAARFQVEREIRRNDGEKVSLKRVLSGPLVVTAMLSGFAHGANDVANIAGPLSVLLESTGDDPMPLCIILLGAISISAGSFIFGRRLVRMVGTSITRLNPARAFCAALAAGATVLACSALGLPVSTTHCAVGGIFGVGFYREWEDRYRRKARKALPIEEINRRHLVRRSHVWTTLAAWAITVPCAGLAAAATYGIITLAF